MLSSTPSSANKSPFNHKRWSRAEWALLLCPLLVVLCIFGWKTAQSIYSHGAARRLSIKTISISSLAYSPDSKLLVVTGWQQPRGLAGYAEIFVYDAKNLERKNYIPGDNSVIYHLAFSPDGKILAASRQKDIQLLDVASGHEIVTLPNIGDAVCRFSADGKFLFATNRKAEGVWDIRLMPPKLLDRPILDAKTESAELIVSPDGTAKAEISTTKTSNISNEQEMTDGDESKVDGGKLRIYDAHTGKLRYTAPGDLYQVAAFNPHKSELTAIASILDGYMIYGLVMETIDLKTQKNKMVILRGSDRWAMVRAAISPDTLLVAAGDETQQIHLFDGQTGTPLHVWGVDRVSPQESTSLSNLQFSPDGQQLICSRGSTIEIYDMTAFNSR